MFAYLKDLYDELGKDASLELSEYIRLFDLLVKK